jgi:hypothetical protein
VERIVYDVLEPHLPRKMVAIPESLQQLWVQLKPRGNGPEVDLSHAGLHGGVTQEITWGPGDRI